MGHQRTAALPPLPFYMWKLAELIELSRQGIQSGFPRSQYLGNRLFALLKRVLHLVERALRFAAQPISLILNRVADPFTRVLTRLRSEQQRHGGSHSHARQKSQKYASRILHPDLLICPGISGPATS